MKKIIKILYPLVIFSFCIEIQTSAKDIWDYTLIGFIKDKKAEKAAKGTNKQNSDINQVQKIASHEGVPMTMQELLEQGIVLKPELIEQLTSFGVDIASKLDCNPFIDIIDPLYEWTQYDNKLGSVTMTQYGLSLVSKSSALSAMSVVDLKFDPQDTCFEFGLAFYKTQTEDNKYVGVILDYENNNNFKAIVFSKKDYIYYSVEKGETSVIKQGLVKPGKYIDTIFVKYEGSKLNVILNGLEVTTLTRITITSPICGIIVSGKRNAICDAFYFNTCEQVSNQDQSTSDT
ncbi:MAG: hypothetical protein K2G13_05830 [Muribaculaceae bacterium]|nr:hypothetical protein [Muribaculaceae bacterium]